MKHDLKLSLRSKSAVNCWFSEWLMTAKDGGLDFPAYYWITGDNVLFLHCFYSLRFRRLQLNSLFTGLLRETMVYTLKCQKENNHILLATMQVFIEEPSMDWFEHAHKLAKKQEKEDVNILHLPDYLKGILIL